MDSMIASYLARIAACQVRVAAMQAANQDRQDKGYAQAYGEDAFTEEAATLERIADTLRDSYGA